MCVTLSSSVLSIPVLTGGSTPQYIYIYTYVYLPSSLRTSDELLRVSCLGRDLLAYGMGPPCSSFGIRFFAFIWARVLQGCCVPRGVRGDVDSPCFLGLALVVGQTYAD